MQQGKKFVLSLFLLAAMLTGCTSNPEPQPTMSSEPPASDTVSLKVATWNVDSKAHPDINKMSEIIHDLGIEIMGFQEIDVNNERNNRDMVQEFVNENYPYVHFAKGRDFANGGFGVGITSAHELLELSSIPIESTSSKATKTLERAVIEKEGKRISFYVTHTSWENIELRRRQIAQIIERVQMDPNEYKIMVADWNAELGKTEYAMFEDEFNIANGKDGNWLDTFNGSETFDPLDNIITTKNITISNVDQVRTDMADHDLLYCDLTLHDQIQGSAGIGNVGLGQGVAASSTAKDSDPMMLNDCDMETLWESETGGEQSVIIEMDRLYQGKSLTVFWGDLKPESIEIQTSADGVRYEDSSKGELTSAETKVDFNGTFKYLKLTLLGNADKYQIRELQIFADRIPYTADHTENVLIHGDMEDLEGWQFRTDFTSKETKLVKSELSGGLDADAAEGSQAYKITRTHADGIGKASLVQYAEITANKKYQLSFEQKTDTLGSASFGYEVIQYDSQGQALDLYHVTLNDNLNLSQTYRRNDYNFTTAPNASSVDILFHVTAGEGSLWLDNVSLKQAVPTEAILLTTDKTLLTEGETGLIQANILPNNYTDLKYHWISTDESVVTVDDEGKIRAKGTGQAYVGLRNDSDLAAESLILITVQ